jgi:hypothetical protein
MEKKKVIGWSVSGVVLMLIIWVGVAAASIGGEASKLDTMLTKAMKDHRPIADV